MKQNFDVKGGPQIGCANVPLLRHKLVETGLDGFYVPHEDEYQNEYLPDANERLAWVSGFTGSFGSALIMTARAAIFVDGRYTIQAAEQTDPDLFERVAVPDPGAFGWIAAQDFSDQRIGYDPALMTPNDVQAFEAAAKKAGATIIAVTTNPIDAAWQDRPAQPQAPVIPHNLEHAGQSSEDKRRAIAASLVDAGADAVVITAPASIAWLFNIRGGDVACSPLPLARAILRSDASATLFLDPAKETPGLGEHLGNQVTLAPLDTLDAELEALSGQTISLDPALASAWFFQKLDATGATIQRGQDPVLLPKACKNAAEIAGTREAHLRDAAAMVAFLAWLDAEAPKGTVTEIYAVTALEGYRAGTNTLQDISFETISGAGPNGAIVHYRVTEQTNRTIEQGELYLVDSEIGRESCKEKM